MIIELVRHGQTDGNVTGAYIGTTDLPVNKAGLLHAEKVEKDRSVKHVYVTPLQRTQQTAAILFPDARQTIIPELAEMDFGRFEGFTAKELENDPDHILWAQGNFLGRCPGGESFEDVGNRCTAALLKIAAEEEARGAERVVFVVHGCVIAMLLMFLAGDGLGFYDYNVNNLCGYRLEATGEVKPNGLPVYRYERVTR